MDYLPSALTVAKTIGTVASLVASSLAVLVYKRSLARKAREENKYKPPIDEAGWSKIFPEAAAENVVPFTGISSGDRILLVGVTGGTGQQVVRGVMEAETRGNIVILTRNPSRPAAQQLAKAGCELVQGDLDDEASLNEACKGIRVMYCHGTSVDAAEPDPIEVLRAERLARAARKAGVAYIVYQSAGGADRDTGLLHMEQKGMVEKIFQKSGIPGTMLRATLFMEELWKKYTRPAILKGTFSFAMPPTNKQQFVSCRDMGYAAAMVFKKPSSFKGLSIELAADELEWSQVAQAFSENQVSMGLPPVKYKEVSPHLFWLISEDL